MNAPLYVNLNDYITVGESGVTDSVPYFCDFCNAPLLIYAKKFWKITKNPLTITNWYDKIKTSVNNDPKDARKKVNAIMMSLEIKGARTRLGFKQNEVADQLGISLSSYQKKESGQIPFTEAQKFQLAKILKLTPMQTDDWLFDGQFGVEKLYAK